MTGRKDPYMYLQCEECGDIFRLLKSQRYETIMCPSCRISRWAFFFKKVTRKIWRKSNEVKPDNVA